MLREIFIMNDDKTQFESMAFLKSHYFDLELNFYSRCAINGVRIEGNRR